MRLRNRVLVSTSVVVDISFNLDASRHLEVIDIYYVPQFKRNLISVSCLNKFEYSVTFNKMLLLVRMTNLFAKVHWKMIYSIYIEISLTC